MSTIATIEQFAAEFANDLFPRETYPANYSEIFQVASIAIQKWENSKPEPVKSAFTKMWTPANTRAVPVPHGERLLWLMSDGSYFTGEYVEALHASDGCVTTEAYASLPYVAEVL